MQLTMTVLSLILRLIQSLLNSKITGSKNNKYNLIREFDTFCKYVGELGRKIDPVDFTRLRPTSIFIFRSLYRKVIWKLDKKNYKRNSKFDDFEEVLTVAYDFGIDILERIRNLNHMSYIKTASLFVSRVSGFPNFDIIDEFWRRHFLNEQFENSRKRAGVSWSPTDFLDE